MEGDDFHSILSREQELYSKHKEQVALSVFILCDNSNENICWRNQIEPEQSP